MWKNLKPRLKRRGTHSSRDDKAGRSGGWGQPRLCGSLVAGQSYTTRVCLKEKKKKGKRTPEQDTSGETAASVQIGLSYFKE